VKKYFLSSVIQGDILPMIFPSMNQGGENDLTVFDSWYSFVRDVSK